jgi:hypothetical protein
METILDYAQETVSGQPAKMGWGLGLNVPVPMCPFVTALPAASPGAA